MGRAQLWHSSVKKTASYRLHYKIYSLLLAYSVLTNSYSAIPGCVQALYL